MTEQTPQDGTREEEKHKPEPRDAAYWARYAETLKVAGVAEGATNINVEGRRAVGPLQGFGKMWQKTFRVCLNDPNLTPAHVIAAWKEHFPEFWPRGNTFYAPLAGIRPGEVALLSLAAPGPVKLHTGMLVLYADDESFTLMTPQGHMFSAWITFSAFRDADGTLVVQVQALERASDPLFELALSVAGHRINRRFWEATLRNLAAHFGLTGEPTSEVICVDRRRQWRYAVNVRHNAGFRSALFNAGAPIRWLRRSR